MDKIVIKSRANMEFLKFPFAVKRKLLKITILLFYFLSFLLTALSILMFEIPHKTIKFLNNHAYQSIFYSFIYLILSFYFLFNSFATAIDVTKNDNIKSNSILYFIISNGMFFLSAFYYFYRRVS